MQIQPAAVQEVVVEIFLCWWSSWELCLHDGYEVIHDLIMLISSKQVSNLNKGLEKKNRQKINAVHYGCFVQISKQATCIIFSLFFFRSKLLHFSNNNPLKLKPHLQILFCPSSTHALQKAKKSAKTLDLASHAQ